MAQNISRVGKRVEQLRVNDAPHDLYRQDGTPVLRSISIDGVHGGKIIEKRVEADGILCPRCSVPAKYDDDSEPICPECGLICDGGQAERCGRSEFLVIDAKAAGRV